MVHRTMSDKADKTIAFMFDHKRGKSGLVVEWVPGKININPGG